MCISAGSGPAQSASTPTAKKDAQVLAFFRSHPRLARTPAGQRAILAALLRRVERLEAQVRRLSAAKVARTPPRWWLEQAACIRSHEGGWTTNTGNGFYGAYQFMRSTWESVGGTGYPHEATPEEQTYRAWLNWKANGERWGGNQWPNSSRYCGLE